MNTDFEQTKKIFEDVIGADILITPIAESADEDIIADWKEGDDYGKTQ